MRHRIRGSPHELDWRNDENALDLVEFISDFWFSVRLIIRCLTDSSESRERGRLRRLVPALTRFRRTRSNDETLLNLRQ